MSAAPDFKRGICGVYSIAVWLITACAWGGMQQPLYIGNMAPVRDQYGRVMVGSSQPANAANRSRLEIRTTADGVIRPPGPTGAPHPLNPLLSIDSLGGVGLNAGEGSSGLFCMVCPERPATGTKIFVRAFNAPELGQASFYADTAVVSVPAQGSSMIVAFGTARPLDSGDDDGDGLVNSWEKALGIDDRLTDDYDGDGMSDYHEMLAGTAPDDSLSLLAFRSIRREAGSASAGAGGATTRPVRVKWQSISGKTYELQYIPDLVGEQEIIPVGTPITAGDGEYEMEMLVDLPGGAVAGTFRVKLVVEE